MQNTTELLEELRRYRAADLHEAQHQRAVLDLLCYGERPFSRDQFVPGHVTASCFIVDRSSRRVLLHHHRRLGRWLQMGGHIEEGETTMQAALREAREESGLGDLNVIGEGVIDIDVHDIPAGKGEPDHAHFDVRYVACTSSPDAIKIDRSESNELAWVALDAAVPLMNEESAKRAMLKIRKLIATR